MNSAPIDRVQIAARIPHAGTMCLLDEAVRWDANTIECRGGAQPEPPHPPPAPRPQAAVHGALVSTDFRPPSRPGYIGAVRAVQLHATRLDEAAEDLTIRAERLAGDAGHVLYAFTVCAGERVLAEGRISVALGAAA